MVDLRIAINNGTDTVLGEAAVAKLKASMRGDLIRPEDGGYDDARKVWNGMIDKRPALIARCTGTDDVIAAVTFGRDHELVVAVRGGGHNYAGKSVCDDGLVIDLSPMKGIRVDPARRIASAEAGLRLGDFDRETQKFGLGTTLGINTDTGIAGLTLGGGSGWLAGNYGLACDNVLSAEVVTADGQAVTASPEQNEDLFWGLRGAGANFGVVTSFEYQLHPVGPVLGGMVLHPLSKAKEVLRFFHEFSSTAPDEVSTAGLLVTAPDGSPAVATVACYSGPADKGEEVLKPLRTFSSPLADMFAVQPYTEMQTTFDEFWPPGRLYYHKASNIRDLSDGAIDTLIEHATAMPTAVSSIYLMQYVHGAASRVAASETAFPHRNYHYVLGVHPATDDPADSEKIIRWTRDCWDAMQPFTERAVSLNGLEDAVEEGEYRLREAYGSNYDRLAALKSKYDPTNFFRLNANIKPAV